MRNLLLFLFLFMIQLVWSQNLLTSWVQTGGHGGNDRAKDIAVDDQGNVYTVGCFTGLTNFDPTSSSPSSSLTSNGGSDGFVEKFDSNGNFLWVVQIGGGGDDCIEDVAIDTSGNVVVTGFFEGTCDFDPSSGNLLLGSNGGEDIFVEKLDQNGNFMWVKQVGSAADDRGLSIVVDQDNMIYSTGSFSANADFDTGSGTNTLVVGSNIDTYILKHDESGVYQNAISFNCTGASEGYGIETMQSGDVTVVGYFSGIMDFDPSSSTNNISSEGDKDAFIIQLNPSLNFNWGYAFGGSSDDRYYDLAIDTNQNIWATGSFQDTIDFDPGVGVIELSNTNSGWVDIFFQQFDPNGNVLAADAIGGNKNDIGVGIAISDQNEVFISGLFSETVDFNSGVGVFQKTSVGETDIFVLKLNDQAEFLDAYSIGGTSSDVSNAIDIFNSSGVHICGNFRGTVDFQVNQNSLQHSSLGGNDFFQLKLIYCLTTGSTIMADACEEFVSPSGMYTWTTTGLHSDTLENIMGCDSIVVVDLTIHSLNAQITNNSNFLTASVSGASYQWLDCDNSYQEINGETGEDFYPSTDGNYAVRIDDGICVDTSTCEAFLGSGLTDGLNGLVSVYPNPSNGSVYIQLEEKQSTIDLFTYNYLGSLIHSTTYSNRSKFQYELPDAPGIYYVKLFLGENSESLVVQLVRTE